MEQESGRPAEVPPPRIGKLAKLPLFVDLHDRRAIVAGGTAAAAWKAELLSAAGAAVQIYADQLGPEMQALLAREPVDGSLHLTDRRWQTKDLRDAAVAVLDTEDLDEAQRFRAAAHVEGAICSVIDKPTFCDVQFGAIVNRSPVVVGISTGGAAPILAQAIRRRIETVLPPNLADWARFAQSLRRRIGILLPNLAARRAFWERFADFAFTCRPPATPELLLPTVRQQRQETCGGVTLVGAGPGDADLLTLKAVRALQSADVILFDDLVSDDVLELARREAKRLLVGKRGGRPSCRQEDINEVMVKLARQGKRVVRLKAGDPMIFGRAGEEIAVLESAGIPVSVVPGITAAAAAAAGLGASLTHRQMAQSVRFITGHSRDGGLPTNIDWNSIADDRTTLIFYMAGRTGSAIMKRLLAAGLAPATPAFVMVAVSRPEEARWLGRLEQLEQGIAQIGTDRPVLIGIGGVFAQAKARRQAYDYAQSA